MRTLFLAPLIALAAATPAVAAPLTVDLAGVRSAPGRLFVSVQTREQFMQDRGSAGSVTPAPKAGSHRFVYELPAGEYAVSVWHDDNDNGKFDASDKHVPLDGWALSNGDKLRGEPTFDQVKTTVAAAPVGVSLKMVYGR